MFIVATAPEHAKLRRSGMRSIVKPQPATHAAPTELGVFRSGRYYKHGAPNGACSREIR
jgi:hypothetical protein